MSQLVLVAEDDFDLRRLLTRVLLAHGYNVATATNGREAWDQLERVQPTMLVSDVTMPERTGLDVLEQLRNAGSRLPVVLITGYAAGVEAAGTRHGAVVLAKPFTAPELLDAMARAFAR